MPSLAIQIDGARAATIDLSGMEVVGATLHGALDQEAKAVLDSMGGNYSEGGCGSLVWVADRPLAVGQVATFQFLERCEAADKGRTISEQFPGEEAGANTDDSITDARAAELRARPRVHRTFTVKVETSNGMQATASSDESNTDYRLGLLWDWTRPDQIRVHLSTNCVDDVLARKAGTSHLEDVLAVGGSATFTLVQ